MTNQLKEILGQHIICDFWEVDKNILNDKNYLVKILTESCIYGEATILEKISYQFTPQGVTILILLSESHCSIHTWPEKNYAGVDIFTCGDKADPEKILQNTPPQLINNNTKNKKNKSDERKTERYRIGWSGFSVVFASLFITLPEFLRYLFFIFLLQYSCDSVCFAYTISM